MQGVVCRSRSVTPESVVCGLAEFDILPHLHANGVSEIVDVMYVEWHHAKNSVTEEQKVAGQAAQVAMMTQGTRFPEYNSPA